MQVTTEHILALREAINVSEPKIAAKLKVIYQDMVLSIRPKISSKMLEAVNNTIVAGQSYEIAATQMGLSKPAVGQAVIKGVRRLVDYEILLGRPVPQTLVPSHEITGVAAAKESEFFISAYRSYIEMD
ncbi:hypothetical protein VCR15J2_390062 [Vibrio coralliirubri]|uniref:hypothetical protein n=1 Tax=Vibrio coralliirubri TaxID=1516159 RepID=UPI000638FA11|nr:hypothetical protein [Vibrio coralliirubri]CDT53364.1 hypothetical protein VCR15J2_390062 [Vibrio coralliirubri]